MTPEDRRERPPVPRWLGALGEPLYRAVIALRNRRFDRGVEVSRFPIPIISVGNLSVGGTGKTPMVAMLARHLLHRGSRPAVVMRGYRAKRGEHSDEEAEYRQVLGDRITVKANPNRAESIRGLISDRACDAVILDDGFQHRRVARDVDIVLLDASRDPFADRCLPAGWLREPVDSLARADAVVLTHADAATEDRLNTMERACAQVNPGLIVCRAEHDWSGIRTHQGATSNEEPVDWLRAKRIILACGIGNPSALLAQARHTGAEVIEHRFAPDHHHWNSLETGQLIELSQRSRADAILTTGKDWVKLAPLVADSKSEITFVVPMLEMRLLSNAPELWALIDRKTVPRDAR